MRVDFPGLLIERHRNGRLRYRVRVEGDKARRIPVPPPDDPDFAHHYHAARALHEAVLPRWEWVLNASHAKIHPLTDTKHLAVKYGRADNPARAWLIAIIRALITQEE